MLPSLPDGGDSCLITCMVSANTAKVVTDVQDGLTHRYIFKLDAKQCLGAALLLD